MKSTKFNMIYSSSKIIRIWFQKPTKPDNNTKKEPILTMINPVPIGKTLFMTPQMNLQAE